MAATNRRGITPPSRQMEISSNSPDPSARQPERSGFLVLYIAVKVRVWAVLVVGFAALAQQANVPKDSADQEPSKEAAPAKPAGPVKEAAPAGEPAPLFGGQLKIRSSEKTKESATLGFNGIDPSGKVEKQMLATAAAPEHLAQVRKLAEQRPKEEEVAAFAEEGGLSKQ
jgi:hypothetical protein